MDCSECQDIIRNATAGIYDTLKPFAKRKQIDDQAWTLTVVLLKKIENQVASKCTTQSTNS